MSSRYCAAILAAALTVPVACAESSPTPRPEPTVSLTVAPLELTGVADAVYDLSVTNADDEVVWTRRLTSTGYGDGAGSLSYVGTCDASDHDADPATDQPNTVTLDLVGVYADRVASPGAFGDAAPTDVSAGAPLQIVEPGALSKDVDCVADADVRVDFSLTVARPANQGFFDIAVEFSNIFCSAKLDCTYPDADSDGVDEPILLLQQPGGGRGPTAVMGFACTAGAGDVDTTLYLDDVVLACDGELITVIPRRDSGNGFTPSEPDPNTDDALYQYAVYYGEEQLTQGGDPLNKRYWNVALGLDPATVTAAGGCTLTSRGTASDGLFVGGLTPPEGYPAITWDVDIDVDGDGLLDCGRHPLDGPGSGVVTTYTQSSPYAWVGPGHTQPGGSDPVPCGDQLVEQAIGYWPLSTSLQDDIAANALTDVPATSLAFADVTGGTGPDRAASFDGSTQYATADATDYTGNTAFTVMAWAAADSTLSSPRAIVARAFDVSSTYFSQAMVIYLSPTQIQVYVGGSAHAYTLPGGFDTEAFHHYAAAWDTNAGRLHAWIDGVEVLDEPETTPLLVLEPARPFVVGAYELQDASFAGHFPGQIAQVLLYDVALDQTQVTSLMTATWPCSADLCDFVGQVCTDGCATDADCADGATCNTTSGACELL